jgi:hypothetical protein
MRIHGGAAFKQRRVILYAASGIVFRRVYPLARKAQQAAVLRTF